MAKRMTALERKLEATEREISSIDQALNERVWVVRLFHGLGGKIEVVRTCATEVEAERAQVDIGLERYPAGTFSSRALEQDPDLARDRAILVREAEALRLEVAKRAERNAKSRARSAALRGAGLRRTADGWE